MNLEFFVKNRKITRKGMGSLVADTLACDTFTIDFDREWDGLVKVVELKNGGDTAQVLYTGKTALPRQVCGRGLLSLTCHGYGKLGDQVAVLRTMPMVRPVKLVGSAAPSQVQTQPITPGVYEQTLACIARAEQAAKTAAETAQSLLELRDAGAFKGEKGENGISAAITVAGLVNGSPAKVENLGTDTHARLRFTIPYGMSEEEKQQLAQTVKDLALGDVDLALEEILRLQQALMEEVTA